jgi:AraC-like DNA-binding protein
MKDVEIRRLSEFRSVLEGFAASHAARNATHSPETLARMRSTVGQLIKAVRAQDYLAFRRADLELHRTIIGLANIPTLEAAWRVVWEGLLPLHKQGFDDYFPDSGTIAEEHEYLVDTIAFGDPAAAEDAARTHIEAVWLRIAEQASSKNDAESSPLKRATVHLAFRLHCPLTLTHVANKIAFTSPGNLSRLFRRHHGVSFQVYLQRLRMKKAAELLSSTRLPVARIAKRVGYSDASRFSQHFKRVFDAAPVAYRMAGARNTVNAS